MKKSATQLGKEYSLTGEQMNYIFKEQGYLEGEPGDYSPTSKGRPFAYESENHWGTGGYSIYNRYCTTRQWDDGILEELDLSDEVQREARAAVAERKRLQREERKAASEAYWAQHDPNIVPEEEVDLSDDSSEFDGMILGGALCVLIGVGVWKVAVFVKEKVVPKIKNRLAENKSF